MTMLTRWEIADAPTQKDPARRELLVRATLSDVRALVKRFGAVLGRPRKKAAASGYTYGIFLNGLTDPQLAGVEKVLRDMSAGKAAPAPPPPPVEAPAAPVVEAQAPPPPPEEKKGEEAPLIELKPPSEPEKGSAVPEPKTSGGPDFGALRALDPAEDLDGLAVGTFNRFAHASAMAVANNPAQMYNPLFLFGPPGAGKTRMLNAVALKLREHHPDKPPFWTSGARLAWAVSRAKEAGRSEALREAVLASGGLFIDDFHLMEIGPDNREELGKLLSAAVGAGRQVMASSLYPPRLLGGLEEALQFRFSGGFAVDLKTPTDEPASEMAASALSRAGFSSEDPGTAALAAKVASVPTMMRTWVGRLAAMRALLSASGRPASAADLLGAVFLQEKELAALPAGLSAAKPPAAAAGAAPAGLFHPNGAEAAADSAWSAVQERLKGLGAAAPWAPARRAYDPAQVYGTPFALAAELRRLGARAALLSGPPPGTELAEREGDFRYALEHLAADCGARLGWISLARTADPAHALWAALDMWDAGGPS